MGTRSKRKASKSAPPPPHSQAVYSPKNLRSMTSRKASGTSVPPTVGGTAAAAAAAVGSAGTAALYKAPVSRVSSAPPSVKSTTARLSPANAESTSSGILLETGTPPPVTSTDKGKGKEAPLPPLNSLDSSPYITSYPHTPHIPSVVDLSYCLPNLTSRMPGGPPRVDSRTSMAILASLTPSLTSLLPDPSAAPGSLLLSPAPQNLFAGPAARFNIWVEPLADLVERWHIAPKEAEDPLDRFGGRDRLLPDQTEETSTLMRQMLLWWRTPHRLMYWDSLAQDLPRMISTDFTLQRSDFREATDAADTKYFLRPALLEGLGHVMLAVQQILLALSELRDVPAARAFQVDPQYTFTRALEEASERFHLELAWETLVQ
ncbi:hypothetical protein PTI98_011867 [Pleurotus ostreatus]|nr:hypothetical protein PTI98_011867 [Pleurotus ostreatus]